MSNGRYRTSKVKKTNKLACWVEVELSLNLFRDQFPVSPPSPSKHCSLARSCQKRCCLCRQAISLNGANHDGHQPSKPPSMETW